MRNSSHTNIPVHSYMLQPMMNVKKSSIKTSIFVSWNLFDFQP